MEVRGAVTDARVPNQAKNAADDKPLAVEKEPLVAASTDPAQRARESLVQVLLNHTEFVTIR